VVVADCAMADEDVRVLKSIEQFLFREARALDHRDYEAWFAMLTDDVRYVVSAQEMREAGSKPVSYALIDEGRAELGQRIDQIKNPRLSRAENPPSLSRRMISNIEILGAGADHTLKVSSYIMAYRARGNVPQGGFYVGHRSDVVRMTSDGLRLAHREVVLDQAILFDGALTTIL
jgi:3-phenylpropionate/cinnamic acid dioxygenase small subunit